MQEEGAAEMAGSQSVATATALRALGRDVPEMVVIAAVPEGSPSAGVFEPGDVLVSVDGVPAASADAVGDELCPGLLQGTADTVEGDRRHPFASVRPLKPADRDDGDVGAVGEFGLLET